MLGPLEPNPLAGFLPWFLGPLGPDHIAMGSNRAQGPFGAHAPLPVAQGLDPGASDGFIKSFIQDYWGRSKLMNIFAS